MDPPPVRDTFGPHLFPLASFALHSPFCQWTTRQAEFPTHRSVFTCDTPIVLLVPPSMAATIFPLTTSTVRGQRVRGSKSRVVVVVSMADAEYFGDVGQCMIIPLSETPRFAMVCMLFCCQSSRAFHTSIFQIHFVNGSWMTSVSENISITQ